MNLYLVSRSFETGILFNRSISKRHVEHDTLLCSETSSRPTIRYQALERRGYSLAHETS